MGTLSGLLQWWNLIFLLPIALSVLLLLASAAGGLGEGGAHAPADGVAASGDVDTDTHADADPPLFHDALHWLGVGVVPLSLLLQAFLLFFGVFGLAANRALGTAAQPERLAWGALVLAALGGLAGAGALGALGRRFLPRELPAPGHKDLVGRTGRVVFQVTQTMGTAQVRDAGGTLHQIPVRIPAGHAPLAAGEEIIVAAYDTEAGAFLVDESPFTFTAEELRRHT